MKQRNLQMIKTNGVTLYTVVEGKGPLVVLLHGFPQRWYPWRHQIDPLVAAGGGLLAAMDQWVPNLLGKVIIEGAGHWVQAERPAPPTKRCWASRKRCHEIIHMLMLSRL